MRGERELADLVQEHANVHRLLLKTGSICVKLGVCGVCGVCVCLCVCVYRRLLCVVLRFLATGKFSLMEQGFFQF